MVAELLGGEVGCFPFVDVVDGAMLKVLCASISIMSRG